MEEDIRHFTCVGPSPRTLLRRSIRSQWYAKFQSDAATSAKINGRRYQQLTYTSYVPSTHPAIGANLNGIQNGVKHLALLKNTVQSLRINICVDPFAVTFAELQTLCLEASSKEASTYATLIQHKSVMGGTTGGTTSDDLLVALEAEYNFVLKTRRQLEIEIARCGPSPFARVPTPPLPTPHARIALADRSALSDILSFDTLHRQFVSVPALTSAIVSDILIFLTNKQT
jgi:hypothetical protein